MFSINPVAPLSKANQYPPLHSTMFSINLTPSSESLWHISLYIPLCFLLIPRRRSVNTFRCFLYIPLCFLLITVMLEIYPATLFLYIPLCFLLIPRRRSVNTFRCFLYIPLCFLLITVMLEIYPATLFLYIPLCFLLIRCPPRS